MKAEEIIQKRADELLSRYRNSVTRKAVEEMVEQLKKDLNPQTTAEAGERFYFTYGSDSGYPFRGGWTLVIAPNLNAAIQIFKAHHPNRPGSGCLNCADYYRAEYFENSESYKDGNLGGGCHEIIGPYPAGMTR